MCVCVILYKHTEPDTDFKLSLLLFSTVCFETESLTESNLLMSLIIWKDILDLVREENLAFGQSNLASLVSH